MVGAFGLGSIAGKTGLLRRISLWVLSLFPPTFNGQVLGLLASGTVIGPLVPSMNAKAALSSPISLAISDSLGVERKSPAASGLLGACYGGFVLMAHFEVLMAGTGGQGLVFCSSFLAEAAIKSGKNVVQTQSYGISQRGGFISAEAIIDDGEIMQP